MASKKHQFLLGLLLKQAYLANYKIFYIEGKFINTKNDEVSIPPKILRHRPDAVGISITGQVCICEAKTETDINCNRTKEQLLDFTSVKLNNFFCEVFMAIPRSSENILRLFLEKIGLEHYPNLYILRVPDEIINEEN